MTIIVDLSGGGTGGSAYWNRATTTISPKNAGDTLDMGTGAIDTTGNVSTGNLTAGAADEAGVVEVKDASEVTKIKLNSVGDSYFNGGNVVIGDTTSNTAFQVKGNVSYTPSSIQAIVAGTGITSAMLLANKVIRVAGSGGAVTITATPSIAAGYDGQEISIEGTHDTNTVTFQDESNLAGSHNSLAGGVDFAVARNQRIKLAYNTTDSRWVEDTRSNNLYTAT